MKGVFRLVMVCMWFLFMFRVVESVKALEVCQSAAPFDVYDVNQNVMPLAPMSPTMLAAPTSGGTAAVSLAFNNHINSLIGQVRLKAVQFCGGRF